MHVIPPWGLAGTEWGFRGNTPNRQKQPPKPPKDPKNGENRRKLWAGIIL